MASLSNGTQEGVSDAFIRVPARWTDKFAAGEIDFDQHALMIVLVYRANYKTRRLPFHSYGGLCELVGWKYGKDQLRKLALPFLAQIGEVTVEGTHQGRGGGVVRISHGDWFGKPDSGLTSDVLRTDGGRTTPFPSEVAVSRPKLDAPQTQSQTADTTLPLSARPRSLDVAVEEALDESQKLERGTLDRNNRNDETRSEEKRDAIAALRAVCPDADDATDDIFANQARKRPIAAFIYARESVVENAPRQPARYAYRILRNWDNVTDSERRYGGGEA
jgi:hypothetical protein